MSRTPASRRLIVIAAIVAVALGGGVLFAGWAQADTRETAIVALGDSTVSGEAADAYEPGTDQPSNYCHRSRNASITMTRIKADHVFNLACSGATTADVASQSHYGESPQVERLAALAAKYRIKMVLLGVGANDVGWGNIVLSCIAAFIGIEPPCRQTWGTRLQEKVTATAPGVAGDLAAIKKAAPRTPIVLESYASPVTPDNRYGWTRSYQGCPVTNADAAWARDTAVPAFRQMLAAVAATARVRFLDLSVAMRGREVCARGIDKNSEWESGVSFNPMTLRSGINNHMFQETFHPNARGHAAIGGCLGEFFGTGRRTASCTLGSDGALHPTPLVTSGAPADPRTAA